MSKALPGVDPVKLINESPLSGLQILVVTITILLNALDGFDLLSISFAAPGIAAEWGIDRSALGLVLSMELVGMGIGALFMGGFADSIGRRNSALVCLTLMLAGMLAVTKAHGVIDLSVYRVITGIGLGGMLATNNALVAEYSNNRQRRLCISLMVIGFSLGGIFGGWAASVLLTHFEWRSIFYFGAALTAAFIPVVFFLVPETIPWLTRKRPDNALVRINKTLARMGHAAIDALPNPIQLKASSQGISSIFRSDLLIGTGTITLVYLLHAITFYFVLKWAPKLVTDLGYHPSSASTVLIWANLGGAIGGACFGAVARRFSLKWLFAVALVGSGVTVFGFGAYATSLQSMSVFAGLNGFFCVSALAGSYAAMAQIYPTQSRAFGTGFTLGVGRGGAILSPILAGLLFSGGFTLLEVSYVMGAGSIIAGLLLAFYPLDQQDNSAS